MTITALEKESPLVEYLRTPQPMYALLLAGPWGVGKSFYWTQFVINDLPSLGKAALTFSVAGLMDLEEIERAMFMASIEKIPGIVAETTTVISKALLRLLKVEPTDITLKADLKIGKTVVCIDDVERFAGKFSILFGFIVSLVEASQIHVVLIANEDKISKKYFGIKEKIVGRVVSVPLDLRSFYKFSVGNVGDSVSNTQKVLMAFEDQAIATFEAIKLENLRTMRAIIHELALILGRVSWPKSTTVDISTLVSAVAFHRMAVADNAENAKVVADAFSQSSIATVLSVRQISKNRPGNRVGDEEETQRGIALDHLYELIKRFARYDHTYAWPKSIAFASMVRGLSFDPEQIVEDFRVFQSDDQPVSAFIRLHEHRGMTEQKFASTVAELEGDIQNGRFRYTVEMWGVFEYLYAFSKRRLTRFTPKEATQFFLGALSKIDANTIEDGAMHLPPQDLDKNQKEVRARIDKIAVSVRARKDIENNKDIIDRIITGELGETSKWMAEPWKRGIFAHEDSRQLLKRLTDAGTDAIERMIQFLIKRQELGSAPDTFYGEDVFAVQMTKLIRKGTRKSRPMLVRDSALLDLADEFENLARKIKPQ